MMIMLASAAVSFSAVLAPSRGIQDRLRLWIAAAGGLAQLWQQLSTACPDKGPSGIEAMIYTLKQVHTHEAAQSHT
jgi:hypothetical protein